MLSERVKLEIEEEISGFERTIFGRLFGCFDSIEQEAIRKRRDLLDSKSRNFDPDIDDEACIEEDAYFEEINHLLSEHHLKQEFLNSTATWLFHLFERQKKRVLGSDKTDILKPTLDADGYSIESCQDWQVLNKELRLAANTVKHGPESDMAKKLSVDFPRLANGGNVKIEKSDIERYIGSLRVFWEKVLDGKVVS